MTRRAAVIGVLLLAAGCTQRDLVARAVGVAGAGGAGGADDAAAGASGSAGAAGGCADAGSCEQDAASCEQTSCAAVSNRDVFCAANHAALSVGDGCTSNGPRFRYAICSCEGLLSSSSLLVDGTDPANVAVDHNEVSLTSDVRIAGSLQYGGSWDSAGADPAGIRGGLVADAPPACGCQGPDLLDVAATVAARADDNDNARIQLGTDALDGFAADRSPVVLPCGRYYFRRISGRTRLEIHAKGNVAIFVNGDIALEDGLVIDTTIGARVTLVVAGNVLVPGVFNLGGGQHPGEEMLMIVGGKGTVDLGSEASSISGPLYAPQAILVTRGSFEVTGALLVKRAQLGAELVVHYAPAAAVAGASCTQP